MEAIILVAGMGFRLKPLTDSMPKCLTEIHGRTILDNALACLARNGVKKTTLVIGHLGNKIIEKIGCRFDDMNVCYVENEIYSKTNTSYSLLIGLQGLNDRNNTLIVLEGDVFFENKLLNDFLENRFPTSTVVERYNPNLDGSFVELKNSMVIDWIHKNRRCPDFVISNKFKTVNIHKFDSSFVRDILRPALAENVKREGGKAPIEYVLQDIVTQKGGVVHAFETDNLKWVEIDDANDLKIAEEIFT